MYEGGGTSKREGERNREKKEKNKTQKVGEKKRRDKRVVEQLAF